MHTGEPRLLRNDKKKQKYGWEGSPVASDHMKLIKVKGASATHKMVLNPFTLAKDLREAVFRSNGYWDQLQSSALLQSRFLWFVNEIESYTIELYR
jgi:hypothetical protein